MSAPNSSHCYRQITTPLGDVETKWKTTYQGRPFHITWLRDPLQRIEDRWVITAEDTHREIKPTSKRGTAIRSLIISSPEGAAILQDDAEEGTPEEDEDQPASKTVHIEHSRDDRGVYTLCGNLIPWRTRTGKVRAVAGAVARAGRTPCPRCDTLLRHKRELAEVDQLLQG